MIYKSLDNRACTKTPGSKNACFQKSCLHVIGAVDKHIWANTIDILINNPKTNVFY